MLLQVENLYKAFKKKSAEKEVLNGISFSAESGQLVLIKGKSGAGKSILLSILAGIEEPCAGRISLDNMDITSCSSSALANIRAADIRLIFQSHNLIDSWTVQDNLLAADLSTAHRKAKIEKASALLARFEMHEYLDYYPLELSMGQQMRVVIARAMMVKPKLLLADEPTGELDSETGGVVVAYLLELAKKDNVAVIVASHGYFPDKGADKILELKAGEIYPSHL